MSLLYEPIPTPYRNTKHEDDSRDDCTVVASNRTQSACMNTDISDDGTEATQLSTDVETDSDEDNDNTNAPTGIFIPQYALPWGGRSTNKTAAKWNRRIRKRETWKELKEAGNPRFKSRG